MSKKGVFICIEGLDGSGKTTQARLLAEKLSGSYELVLTFEPSNGKVGSFIRESCLYEQSRLPVAVEALLFAADRVEHVESVIKPALGEGKLVVCDRYVYSSLAYQGSAGLSLDWIKEVNSCALRPDFAVFIDVSPEVVIERLQRRKSVMETLEIQRKVREIYLKFVDTGELVRIDGDRPKGVVADELCSVVLSFLKG